MNREPGNARQCAAEISRSVIILAKLQEAMAEAIAWEGTHPHPSKNQSAAPLAAK